MWTLLFNVRATTSKWAVVGSKYYHTYSKVALPPAQTTMNAHRAWASVNICVSIMCVCNIIIIITLDYNNIHLCVRKSEREKGPLQHHLAASICCSVLNFDQHQSRVGMEGYSCPLAMISAPLMQ